MMRYTGVGQYFAGVPARDLSDEEWAALAADVQAAASGLYVEAEAEAEAKAGVKAEAEAEAKGEGDNR